VVQRGGEPESATLASNRVLFAAVPQLRGLVVGSERGVAGWGRSSEFMSTFSPCPTNELFIGMRLIFMTMY
jgi:hypothetical protein